MKSGIYMIRHVASGRVYVGSSVEIARRIATHRRQLINGRHPNQILQAAWTKHGAEAFTLAVVELCDVDALTDREQHWIGIFGALSRECGFNIAPVAGSVLGLRHTEGAKERIAAAQRGRTRSPETRARISAARKARWAALPEAEKLAERQRLVMVPRTVEQRARQRIAWARKSVDEMNAFRLKVGLARSGWVATPEYRAKMSAVKKGRPLTAAHRAALSVAARRRLTQGGRQA